MNRLPMRLTPFALSLAMAVATPDLQAQGRPPVRFADTPMTFRIAARPLAEALNDWARQTAIQLVVPQTAVAGRSAPAISGELSPRQALERLLAGTGHFGRFDGNLVTIEPLPSKVEADPMLPAVQVTASALRDPTTEGDPSYTATTASILKGASSLKEIPQSVSVITRQRMDDQNLDTLEKALEAAPGVYKDQGRGDISGKDSDGLYYSRGYLISTYMLDGVAVDGTFAPNRFGAQSSTISGSSAIYDRVEVLRGAAGLLVGQGAPGGTVNLVRKRPTRELQQRYLVSAGSADARHVQADLSVPLDATGAVRARLVADYDKRGRYWKYVGTESESPLLYGILDWDLRPGTRIGIGVRHEKYKENQGPRADFQAPWAYRDTTERELFADLRHDFSERWQFNLAATRRFYDLDYLTGVVFSPYASSARADIQARQHEQNTNAADANLLGRFDAWGRQHRLLFGLNGSREDLDPLTTRTLTLDRTRFPFDPAAYDRDVYWPSADSEMIRSLIFRARTNPSRMITRTAGAYGKLDLKIADPLTAVIGARYTRQKFARFLNAGEPDVNANDSVEAVTPYGGLVYTLNRRWTAYASYADIFRPQFDNWTRDGQLVDHIVGANVELGIKGDLLGGRLSTAFALFRIDEKNTAQPDIEPYDEYCPGNPRYPEVGGCVIPIGHKRTQGFDAEIGGEPLQNWRITAGYTFTHTKVLQSSAGSGFPVAGYRNSGLVFPKHLFKLWSSYQLGGTGTGGLTLGGGTTIKSRQVFYTSVRNNTRNQQGGMAIWDVFARYQVDRHISVALNVHNVFDKTYFIGAAPAAATPIINDSVYGTPRTVLVTVSARF